MRIGLYNLEPKYRNLALEKIRMYHAGKGHTVCDFTPMEQDNFDVIYASSIFTFTDKSYVPSRAIVGGTGFDVTTTLPPEIERMKPKLNMGFTTRGCIRNCGFCVVPQKEGGIQSVGDIYDLWDGVSETITLLDNNILALPGHFFKIAAQLQKERLIVDFNQGLDIRLLTGEMARELKKIRRKRYRFAFDHPGMANTIIEKVSILKACGINASLFYVLCGYDTTFDEDVERLELLRSLGQDAFVMRYNKDDRRYIPLANWANYHGYFRKFSCKEFVGENVLGKRGRYRETANAS